MKYITLCKPNNYQNGEFGVPEFLDYLIASDKEFNDDGEGIRSAFRLLKVLQEYKNTEVKPAYLAVEDNDHARVKRAAEKPSKGYPTPTAVHCYNVLTSITEAKDERPEIKEAAAETSAVH